MKTIIFDFDGTLADSFSLIIGIAHDLTKHPKLLDKKEVIRLKDLQLIDVAKELNIPKMKWPYLLFRGRKLMLKKISKIEPFTEIDQLLKSLNAKNYNIYIMSSNSEKNISLFLKKYELNKYIKEIYGSVGLFGKARNLKKIISKNKLNKEDVYYVGDEPRDIEASKKNNIKIISVSWGFNNKELLKKYNPDFIVDHPLEILKIV